ncbi:AraC family transcriptional regulator [Paenibacillus filicis]|uniref:AraC family transcriptional regulator n=1 Tax=Paenibacillus filicis TaxID=669464 RepID=A0ABU9DU65_9BACL
MRLSKPQLQRNFIRITNKGSFYWRSLALVLLISSLPTLLIAIINLYIGTGKIEEEVEKSHQMRISQVSEMIQANLSTMEIMTNRWSTNPLVSDSIRYLDFKDNPDVVQQLYEFLLMMSGSHPWIEQVRLYLSDQEVIISNSKGVNPIRDGSLKTTFLQEYQQQGALYWSDGAAYLSADEPSLTLVYKLPWYMNDSYGALLVDIKRDELMNALGQLNTDKEGISFVMKKGSNWGTDQWNPAIQPFAAELRGLISQKQGAASFTYEWKRDVYGISQGTLPRLDWVFVVATPLSKLTEPVRMTTNSILIASASGIVLAILLALYASRQIYGPIDRLIRLFTSDKTPSGIAYEKDEIQFIESTWKYLHKESRVLQERLELSFPSLRTGFLLQLVQGHFYALTEEEILDKMEQYGWNVKDCSFSLLYIRMSGMSKLGERFRVEDEQLITFAAANIIEEKTAGAFHRVQVINFQDLCVGLLVAAPKSDTNLKEQLTQSAHELTETIHKYLKVNVTIMVGSLAEGIKEIPYILDEARSAIRHRDLSVQHQVIDIGEALRSDTAKAPYSFQLEKEMIHALKLGLEEETIAYMKEFVAEFSGHTPNMFMLQQAMLHLLGSIMHAIMQSGYNPGQVYEGGNLYEELSQIHEAETMLQWFESKVFTPFWLSLQQSHNMKSQLIVEKVLRLIKEEFMNDLSLEHYAEVCGTNFFTLSKIFKDVTGVNFVDYVTGLRIQRAQELLLSTGLKINEIAEQVGYQHSYFNKVFKAHTEMTPSQYRDAHKQR